MFNEDIIEWRRQSTNHKAWAQFNIFFHKYHHKQSKVVTTFRKGGYTSVVQNIYCVPPPPPEEHHDAIDHIKNTVQGIQVQIYDLEGIAQTNIFLTSLNTAVIFQLAKMTVTVNSMQAQLKMLTSASKNQTSSKRKYYCWSCVSNYTHGSKTCSYKKSGHQDEAYYKKRLDRSKNKCVNGGMGRKWIKFKLVTLELIY